MRLQRHKTNSIGARVTLSSGNAHVRRIYEHLTQEIGFYAVGFSPATANPKRLYSIGEEKMGTVLEGFEDLAWEYRDWAVAGRQHGFTNANDTLKELNSGMSKAFPCGAGLGLLGVGTAGDISLCHRFVDSDEGKMGHVQNGGVDHAAREQFLGTHNIGARYDCHTCWARPVCAGGCYHEAFVTMGIHLQATCITAIGSAAGTISVFAFTGDQPKEPVVSRSASERTTNRRTDDREAIQCIQ
jgi:uncharacterized protein